MKCSPHVILATEVKLEFEECAMIDEKASEVFHTLRVSEETETKREEGVKTHVLYSGISASSWLLPIGISVKKQRQNTSVGNLNEECRRAINERAKGQNGIVGSRHFELTKQQLTRQDFIVGKTIASKSASEVSCHLDENLKVPENDNCTKTDKETSSVISRLATRGQGVKLPSDAVLPKSAKVGRRSFDRMRPFTAPSIMNRDNHQDFTDALPTLLIRQCTSLTSQTNCFVETKDELVKYQRSRQSGAKSAPPCSNPQRSNAGFSSLHAMQEALEEKLRQAPVPAWVSTEGRSAGGPLPYPRDLPEGSDKKGTIAKNRFEKDSALQMPPPQSSLKPLMYSQDSEVRHSAGCPYRCKSCFRACLASDDFVQSQSEPTANGKSNNKVAQRRAILRQNKPAWKTEPKQKDAQPAKPLPVWNNRNRGHVIRIIRKEIPLSTYAWDAGPSYTPFSKYDTLITRRVGNESTDELDNNRNSGGVTE